MSGEKPRNFPLPLSSVVDKAGPGARPPARDRVATPQTATQNAARSAAQFGPAGRPGPLPAAYAQQRVQPLAAPVLRPHALVSDAVRQAMVQRVARQGVKDELVLAAMTAVPRHLFIDEALASQAYIDASLPIGQHQTISQPYIVARMIELMRNGGALRRVLEIGTGCGYQAAVLARVAQEVYSIERIKALHELAKSNLRVMRLANLRLQYGDGMLGLPQAAPFDGIILAAAGLEVPHALLEQLTIGGRLVAPVGSRSQHLQLISRVGKTDWISETLEACHFVPLRQGMV